LLRDCKVFGEDETEGLDLAEADLDGLDATRLPGEGRESWSECERKAYDWGHREREPTPLTP